MTDKAENKKMQGSCACGEISLTADQASTEVGVCHCTTCRKLGSGPMFLVDCGAEVTIEGGKNLGLFDSSDWAERGFCKSCGSNLFYKFKENKKYMVSASILNHEFEFIKQVFVEEQPKYYEFSNKTVKMTGKELFAMFGG